MAPEGWNGVSSGCGALRSMIQISVTGVVEGMINGGGREGVWWREIGIGEEEGELAEDWREYLYRS